MASASRRHNASADIVHGAPAATLPSGGPLSPDLSPSPSSGAAPTLPSLAAVLPSSVAVRRISRSPQAERNWQWCGGERSRVARRALRQGRWPLGRRIERPRPPKAGGGAVEHGHRHLAPLPLPSCGGQFSISICLVEIQAGEVTIHGARCSWP